MGESRLNMFLGPAEPVDIDAQDFLAFEDNVQIYNQRLGHIAYVPTNYHRRVC